MTEKTVSFTIQVAQFVYVYYFRLWFSRPTSFNSFPITHQHLGAYSDRSSTFQDVGVRKTQQVMHHCGRLRGKTIIASNILDNKPETRSRFIILQSFLWSTPLHLIICWKFMILFINKAHFSSFFFFFSNVRLAQTCDFIKKPRIKLKRRQATFILVFRKKYIEVHSIKSLSLV